MGWLGKRCHALAQRQAHGAGVNNSPLAGLPLKIILDVDDILRHLPAQRFRLLAMNGQQMILDPEAVDA